MTRKFLLPFLFLALALPVFAQPHYVLNGLTVIYCDNQVGTYHIDTNGEGLVSTDWQIIPPSGAQFISSGLYDASILFIAPGTYTLISTSLTLNQQFVSDTLFVLVLIQSGSTEVGGCYTINPNSKCYQVCAHSTTSVFDPGGTGEWEIVGAESYNTIGQNTIEITWGDAGNGSVHSINHCSDTLCFEILPHPTADFTTFPSSPTDTLVVCQGKEIDFTNTSFNGLSFTWSFGDGEQSQSFNATHLYPVAGDYIVTLTAQSVCECVDEKQMVVRVLPAPTPTLDCVNTVCPESRQRYTATTDGCTQFNWVVSANGTIVNGGGSSDDFIEIIWHEGPDGFIELSVANCNTTYCSFSNIFRIPILTPDGPITGDASVCSGEIVNYTVPYFPGTQYLWQVGPRGTITGGEKTNVVTIRWDDVNTAAFSNVSVQYDNCFLECSGSDQLNISIVPSITMTADDQVCQFGTASANTTAGFITPLAANVLWHLEDSSGTVIFTQPGLSNSFTHIFNYPPGNYQWVAVNNSASYCTELIRKRITVTGKPSSPLGIESDTIICPGQSYGFTIIAAGNYATLWTIRDGANTYNYKGQSCHHIFGNAKPYTVTAVHANIQLLDCVSDPITISLHTLDEYMITGQEDVCFNGINSYTGPIINGADYSWEVIPADFGTIKNTELNKVDVFWNQSGSCTLRLSACGQTLDKLITVHALPDFNINLPVTACENVQSLMVTDKPLLFHHWKDENNTSLSFLNFINLYPGSYALECTDNFGCSAEKTFGISSYPSPEVRISCTKPNTYCSVFPGGVDLVANTDGSGYTFLWYKDGVSTGATGPVYNVNDFATYYVEVTNQYGCKAISDVVTFYNCCTPACTGVLGGSGFPLPPGCSYILYDFDIEKTTPACETHLFTPHDPLITPGQTRWLIQNISDGFIGDVTSDVLNFTYDLPGYYFIYVISTLTGYPYSAGDCAHAQRIIDTVPAVANFIHAGICINAPITFEDLTTFLPSESIAGWSWEFDDPASGVNNHSALQDPQHIFSAAGDYQVKLTVTMMSGCQTTAIRTVHISDGPVLNPIFDPVYCENEALEISLPEPIYDVLWDFGDPLSGSLNTAESSTALHAYTAPGSFIGMVTAADVYGCLSSAPFFPDIRANTLSGLIDVAPPGTLCYGDTATLTSPPGGESWQWNTNETTFQIEVTESNPYSVQLEDLFHCKYSPPPATVIIQPKPDLLIQGREILGNGEYGPWQNELHICQGSEFELEAFSSTPPFFYHWTHGPLSKTISFTEEGGNLPAAGLYEYSVWITAGACSSDTASFTIEIYGLPQIPLIALSSGSGCSFDQNILQVTNPEAGIDYHWSDGQIGTTATIKQAGNYFVTAINDHGCTNKSPLVTIYPSAAVDQIPGGCHIACDPLTVCLPPLENVASWIIYKNGSVFLSGTTWPTDYLITNDGSYTIEVTTINGCVATSDPLDITLYTGVGSITVLTYLDVDHDGMITAADVLLGGIPVEIISDDGSQAGMTFTWMDGGFVFEDYPAIGYTAYFNQSLLPSQWQIVIDSVSANIATCDDSVVVSLLLEQNCTVNGPDLVLISCPGEDIMLGDSIWSDTGQYILHLPSASGCDSVVNVNIVAPDSLQIGATVWVDVDQNGILSPADTVISGITVVLDHLINQGPIINVTDGNGQVGGTYDAGPYIINIDSTLLPPGLEMIYGLDYVADTICGMVHFDFLLVEGCVDVIQIEQEEFCEGDSVLVQGQWLTNSGVYNYLVSQPGSGCDTTLDVYVTVWPGPSIQSSSDWNCIEQGTIEISVSGIMPYQYLWSPSLQGDTLFTGLADGQYAVTVTDGNGCETIDTISIQSPSPLDFQIPGQYDIHTGDSVELIITGSVNESGLTYQWSPPLFMTCPTCPVTWVFPDTSTVYSVLITDENGCLYELETLITVTFDSSTFDQLYIPNVFSPNGDGINDFWRPYTKLENAHINSITLFDRWGEMLFHKENFDINSFEGWDGTFRGQKMQPAVFAYMADITLGDGTKLQRKGNVTLVR